MVMQQINTLWKLIFVGMVLVVGMGAFAGLTTAASDNYYDFECESGATIPLNFLGGTHAFLTDDDVDTPWSAWTAKKRYDGQTVSWNNTQTVERVYYFVDNVPADTEVMFTFTAASQTRYKSFDATSNDTWMEVTFDSVDAESVYIERVDTNGGDVKIFEVRVCVTADNSDCSPSDLRIDPNDPNNPVMVNPETGANHYSLETFTLNIEGDFHTCDIPHTEMMLDGTTCATGEVLSLSRTHISVRFRKYPCFLTAQADMNSGPNVMILIGRSAYSFDLRHCPLNESVWFIH